MDDRCRSCQYICKRLDPGDEPAHYYFSSLSPEAVLCAIEKAVSQHMGTTNSALAVRQVAASSGNQLAVLLDSAESPSAVNCFDRCIVLVAQAEATKDGRTDLWIRYGVPDSCCANVELVSALTALVRDLIYKLCVADREKRGRIA